MRKATILSMVIWFGCGPAVQSSAGPQVAGESRLVVAADGAGDRGWIGGAPFQTQVLVGDDGEVYVGVWIAAPDEIAGANERAPMAVSLVVDTSGSMSGAKIAHARMAASSLLESLADGDIVSVYSFDTTVREIAPPTMIGPENRGSLIRAVGGLQASGMTNLYGGLAAGVAHMQKSPPSHPVRRIMMISDGQANVGPSDPISLGDLAAHATEHGAQVTSIGVGLDYDEQTLGALAVRTAGRLYHLEQPSQMARILESELDLLARTIGVDAFIEVIPGPGVVILGGETLGAEIRDGRLRVPVGSVYAGLEREVLFRARLDTTRPGEQKLAEARLVYKSPTEQRDRPEVHAAALRYQVTRDRAAAEASLDARVRAMVASHEVAKAQLQAAEHLNRGDNQAAVVALESADRELEQAMQRPMPTAQRQRLEKRQQQVRRSRDRAGRAATPQDARGAALESYDAAYEAQGY